MRLRGASAAALLLALCLLPAGIGAATGQRSQARAALDGGLAHAATEQSETLSDYFQRARSLTLIAAHNPVFADFYTAPGTRARKIRTNHALMASIDDGLGYLETLFPGSIGEACFIDAGGAENARTVRGRTARPSELSPDESKNPFFGPTFALPIGAVYQAEPYVSPDTHEWVISNSTPLDTPDRSKPAILHFEVTVESFRAAAARASEYPVAVVDARTGAVVLDSRFPQVPGAPLGRPGDARFASLAHLTGSTGRLDVDGRPAFFHRLSAQPGNANDWVVVAVAPVSVGLLYGIGSISIGLIVAALLLVCLAVILDLLARRELVAAAMTDALTGLGNRRALLRDLEAQLRSARVDRPLVLMLLDLNGFKAYNDTFGHSAGDVLLSRLGRALAAAIGDRGRAYRLGGDEFCVLAPVAEGRSESIVSAATAALEEHGTGFVVDASYGAILLPAEADDPTEALRLVDLRMYAHKRQGRRSADRQSKDVLLHALNERHPELRTRLRYVATLVEAVAQHLELPTEDAHQAVQAAELCEIGYVAVPDTVLNKGSDLDEKEQAFLRNQPVVAERIISAAPALVPTARLVRCVFEHVDGSGHPDGLAGDAIPLGARLVGACHRFVTLVDQHGSDAAGLARASQQLRRESGTRLDATVVEALLAVVAARSLPVPSRP
jgi:diguanylate cyclase (GGDEF)-like protein